MPYFQADVDKLIKKIKGEEKVKMIFCEWTWCMYNDIKERDKRGVCQCIEDVILEVDPETDQLKCLNFEYGKED